MTEKEAIEYLKRADITVGQKIKTKTAEALEMAIHAVETIEKLKRMIDMYSQQGHAPTRTISMENLKDMLE